MDAKRTLKEFKEKFDREAEKHLDLLIKTAAREDAFTAEAFKYVKRLVLAGGKRLRPAFMYYGYLAGGGRDKKRILKAAVSIELVHIFLLIHDDVIDRDRMRHGIESVNAKYEKMGKKLFPGSEPVHFGNSVAVIVGDMVAAAGNQILFQSGFNPRFVIRALDKLQNIIAMTGVGEAQDVLMEYKKKASESEVIRMYTNKTAKYTVEGPLHLGAILAGAEEDLPGKLSAYAIPVGIAFQIQDDILGAFGEEKKLGKPVGSDISSGKQTILIVKAREKADRSQKKFLESCLGKKDLNLKDVEKFREIIIGTGSLSYARKMATDLIFQGKEAMEETKTEKEAKDFFLGIADYMLNREL